MAESDHGMGPRHTLRRRLKLQRYTRLRITTTAARGAAASLCRDAVSIHVLATGRRNSEPFRPRRVVDKPQAERRRKQIEKRIVAGKRDTELQADEQRAGGDPDAPGSEDEEGRRQFDGEHDDHGDEVDDFR